MRCLALAPAPRSEVGTRPMPGPEKPAGGGRDGGLSEIISSVYLLRRSSVSSVSSVSLPVNNNSPSESRHNYMMSSQSWSYSISSDNPISARCCSLLSFCIVRENNSGKISAIEKQYFVASLAIFA